MVRRTSVNHLTPLFMSPAAPPVTRSVTGRYDTVTCIDVMIHYPQDKADAMISHLASLSDRRLVVSFAPKTPYYSVLKRIGELFPGPSKVKLGAGWEGFGSYVLSAGKLLLPVFVDLWCRWRQGLLLAACAR
jgi:hypothetical protein